MTSLGLLYREFPMPAASAIRWISVEIMLNTP